MDTDLANSPRPTLKASAPAEVSLGERAELLAQQIVRVEANFLRLPLFTLDNKHMRTMDGLRCEGTFRRGDKSYDFSYTVTRNVATYYPGPLARSAHFALLHIATDMGLPLANPIAFSWRQLCGRMGIQVSGRTVTALREALIATKGLMIESRTALFSKAERKPITTDERDRYLSVYDEVEFSGGTRPDGSMIDVNAVWFSQWYLDNLNTLYSGPIDYDLWRQLNAKSPIASRMYEFLFFKFFGARDLLRFNYPTFVKFLPARTERYASDAKKQLQPAFNLLLEAGVLANVQWVESRGGLPQLLLHRGPLLRNVPTGPDAFDVSDENFALDRIEDVRTPEWRLVSEFHFAWGNQDFRPAKAELELARELIVAHGLDGAARILPRLVKRLKQHWSDAKTFCAVRRYIPDVVCEIERERRLVEQEKVAEFARAEAKKIAARRAQDQAVLKLMWDGLGPIEQEEIRKVVLASQPPSIRKFPVILERFCLEELGRRQNLS